MPQLDISTFSTQIAWLVITFAALFIIMWRVAVPRISDALEQRQTRMDDNLNKAAEFKKEAEAAIEAYEKSLTEARASAHSVIADVHATIVAETAAKDAELNTQIKAMLSESEASIAKATDQAMSNVRVVAEEVAAAAAERLLGDPVDAAVVSAAVDTATKARN
ncbi:MAG: F0F1 ATP synthase subunit B' [Rhodospirillales bacterium]|nr:F0F1 ATP synthase subunit B' [Rhodospirillales bacterium]